MGGREPSSANRQVDSGIQRSQVEEMQLAVQRGALTFRELGNWPDIPQLVTSLTDDPLLPAVTTVLCDELDMRHDPVDLDLAGGGQPVSMALSDAVLATRSAAIFMDCAQRILRSASVLYHAGKHLAVSVLDQAGAPSYSASPPDVLRAADALEVAAQMRLMNWADRWDVLALLANISGPAPAVYARAVMRTAVSCIEAWPETIDLLPALKRLTGLEAPAVSHVGSLVPDDDQQSDNSLALARVATLQALRAADGPAAVALLDKTAALLAPALAEDDRVDVAIAADIALLLRDLLAIGQIQDEALVPRLAMNVAEGWRLNPQRPHWITDRTAASHAAWSRLAIQLQIAHQRLAEPSWYFAATAIDNIIDLYRVSRSARIYRRNADGIAVRDIIAPTLVEGFAVNTALLHHLQDHAAHLQLLISRGMATDQQIEDLPTAILMRDAAIVRLGETGGGAKRVNSTETSLPPGLSADRVRASIEATRQAAGQTTGSILADDILERARHGFATSKDYKGPVKVAVDFVTQLLVTFVFSRARLGEKEMPYLFDPQADEPKLARDLHEFVTASGQLGNMRTEVRHIGGGRVDMEFSFPGFNLYVELKVDSSKAPLGDKKSYLGQSAAYQVADKRIGFLLVLKRLSTSKQLAPYLGHALEVITVPDGSAEPRHVAAFTLSGARTKPSSM